MSPALKGARLAPGGTIFSADTFHLKYILMDNHTDKEQKDKEQKEVMEGTPTRAEFHHGSTTQGGSNFGQGSAQLGKEGNKQGSESNTGADY
jgi:hypothetical protein